MEACMPCCAASSSKERQAEFKKLYDEFKAEMSELDAIVAKAQKAFEEWKAKAAGVEVQEKPETPKKGK